MQRAHVGKLACLARRVLPRSAGCDVMRVEHALRSDRVRERVLVDPYDAVPALDRDRLGLVLDAFDDDGMGVWRNGCCAGSAVKQAQGTEQRQREWLSPRAPLDESR